MFRPFSWKQNERLPFEQTKVGEGLTSRSPVRESSPIANEMGQRGLESFTDPSRVKAVSIASTLQSPKLLRPIPIANKVLISFEDVEDASESQDFSIRNFLQASGFSSRDEDGAFSFSSGPEGGASALTNEVKKSTYRSFPNGSDNFGMVRKVDVNSEKLGQVDCENKESQELQQNQVRVHDFCPEYIPKVETQDVRYSPDEILRGKLMDGTRASFSGPEDMESIPPASIVTIESPSMSYNSHSLNSMAKPSNEETKQFVTPPTHFRSSTTAGSNNSRASESSSSAASSRGDDSTRSPSLSSLKSSDDHPTKRPGSVSSSSSFKSDDIPVPRLESKQKLDRRRRSREQNRVLRIFDRRLNSREGRDIIDNPWFQAIAIESELDELADTMPPSNHAWKVEQKGKRTKMSKLGRSLKTQGKRNKLEDVNDADPTSQDKKSITISASNASLDSSSSLKDIEHEELRHVLRKALLGKRRLDDVLECMMRVYSRPSDPVLQVLYKYFGSAKTVEASVTWITEELRVLQEDISEKKRSKEIEAYIVLSRIYREILLQIFTTGPGSLKKAFLNSSKVRIALTRFLQKDVPPGRLELRSWARTSVCIFRILNSMMTNHASIVVLYISSQKGLLRSIVSKHICFPEVVSFVSKLCASDALSEASENHLRFGPPNPDGILLLAKENIVDTLSHIFIDSCDARSGKSSELVLDIQRNSLQCLKDISFKAAAMPKFGKANCSMSAKQIKMLNTALNTIALYSATDHVQVGIEYSLRRINESGNGREGVSSSLFMRNYPLIHMLSLSTDLLDAVLCASESKKFAVRRTIGTVSTKSLEDVLLSKLDDLCGLLEKNSAAGTVSTTQLSIIQLFRCLFASDQSTVWVSLSNKRVPELLLAVIEDNELRTLIHRAVIECLQASLKRKDAVMLHKQWIACLGKNSRWMSLMHQITEETEPREGEVAPQRLCQIQCTYVQITSALMDIANSVYETNLSSFFYNHGIAVPFMKKLEVEIKRRREEQNKPCGGPKPEAQTVSVLACAEFLAARLNDVNAV